MDVSGFRRDEILKNKVVLKNKLNVEVPVRGIQAGLVFIDRGGMFHSAVY